MDVVVSITDNILHTSLYSKPTDAHRFLHRLSFHPPHTFRSLPFAQMRRAALICSEMEERERSIDDMIKYFRGCGYKEYSLIAAKNRAMELSRQDLLGYTRPVRDEIPLVFVTTYCKEIPLLKNILKNYQDDIYRLTDKSNVIVACRKNANTSALLFNKFGFCQSILESEAVNQKCGDGRCSTCPLMFETLEPILLNEHNLTLKLSNKYNCKSEDIIYFVQCKVPGCGDFYFGQTTNRLHIRFNNHRQGFKARSYSKSALSYHIHNDHGDLKLNSQCLRDNFNLAIVEGTPARNLDRREDYYIWKTDSSTKHLNRYQAIR